MPATSSHFTTHKCVRSALSETQPASCPHAPPPDFGQWARTHYCCSCLNAAVGSTRPPPGSTSKSKLEMMDIGTAEVFVLIQRCCVRCDFGLVLENTRWPESALARRATTNWNPAVSTTMDAAVVAMTSPSSPLSLCVELGVPSGGRPGTSENTLWV